ncbi:ribosomal-protein-alanine N-acetyltransferase [Alkalihalobacillus xiaoxiensis]|uniref:Ribosomal-protein-alanine N-acetyltransferase n=1 Tax=Shouchella xiaoxiensis TaxID=766895 RepID=A0ABS2SP89_9BACI|nr:GNAT family protein [Shouchella xiaoxiensis]MBM7837328.1 ribosomal-protein-alanine N-acetyltransferase [Shouchella xiaoxiensis]
MRKNMQQLKKLAAFPTIHTKRLTLRQLTHEDAEQLYAYYANESVYRYLDWNGPESIEHSKQNIDRWNKGFEQGWIIRFAIVDNETNTVIGTIFLSDFHGKRAEIGFELSQYYWRRGIMSEAMREVLYLGFQQLHLQRIQAFVAEENVASRQLFNSFNFKEEGLLRQYETHSVTGECNDMLVYSLIQDAKG